MVIFFLHNNKQDKMKLENITVVFFSIIFYHPFLCYTTLGTEKDQSEQIQQMFNLDTDNKALMVLAADTYDDLIRTNSDDAMDYLNLQRVRMTSPHFCL